MTEAISYRDGFLHVENINVAEINKRDDESEPVYIFSKNKIVENIQQYKCELDKQKFRSSINYSMKANGNPAILKIMKENGCSLTLVSGLELKLALELEFPPDEIVFNGNGKQQWEIDLAIRSGVMLNIDSVFNLKQTIDGSKRANAPVNVLLRVNPNIEVDVHHYISTGKAGSKFGLDDIELKEVVSALRTNKELKLVGLHCHLGSTIESVDIIGESTERLVKLFRHLQKEGFDELKYINIGGGLGISHRKLQCETQAWQSIEEGTRDKLESLFNEDSKDNNLRSATQLFKTNKISSEHFVEIVKKTCAGINQPIIKKLENLLNNGRFVPTPDDLIRKIKNYIQDDIHLIIEPGRSLVGNAAVLLCSVLGCKQSGMKNFVVVNCAMTEVIRPCLYGAYHHIDLAEPSRTDVKKVYDVVGPVCESSDFLGKDRFLSIPHEGCLLAIFDVGAYCGSMSMTYNMRRRAAEVMIDGANVQVIRRADTYEDLMKPYRV